MDSWWVPYLFKSCRPDFNQEVTRIVAPYWPPSVYLNSTRIMTPPQARSCLIPMVSWWVSYLPKGCRPDFNNGLGGDSNSGPVLAPGVYLSPTRIMAPPWATPILCQMKSIYLFKSPIYDFLVVTMTSVLNVTKQIRVCLHLHKNLDTVDVVG